MEGHDFGGVGDQGPHFHLRPSDGLKNGHIDGSKDHCYVFPGGGG
ncbi:hypothetical protein K5M36_21085 [Chromobacterium vaccinii]|nr:hypothetical protein [Chromobacterium vaccinii]